MGGVSEAYSSDYDGDYATPPTSLALWFQQSNDYNLIYDNVLADRTGGNNGTINWGSNPAGVNVSYSSSVSSTQPVQETDVAEPFYDNTPDIEVSDWFVEPDLTTQLVSHPLRPIVTIMSDNSTATELQTWRLLGLACH